MSTLVTAYRPGDRSGGLRFLQTDPVPGGSANAYDYCSQDPINCNDLSGDFGWSSIGHFFKKAAHYAGFVGRGVRDVVNGPVTVLGVAWGLAHGGQCGWDGVRWTVVCAGMHGGYGPRRGATIGSVYLTGDRDPDYALLRHEAKHSNQWSWFGGGPLFPIAYGIDELLTGGGSHNNFEQQAGLHDGCYRYRPG